MLKKIILLTLCAAMLSGCSGRTRHVEVPASTPEMDLVAKELAASREHIVHELSLLRKVSPPAPASVAVPDWSSPPEFNTHADLVWNGPVEKGVAALALKIGWQARKFGTAPVQDIIVYTEGQGTVLDVLQSFGAQTGQRANIVADVSSRTFKLIYPDGVKASQKPIKAEKQQKPAAAAKRKPAPATQKPSQAPNSSHKLTPPRGESKPEAVKPDEAKPEAPKSGEAKPETSKPETSSPVPMLREPAKAPVEAPVKEAPKVEAPKPEPAKPTTPSSPRVGNVLDGEM